MPSSFPAPSSAHLYLWHRDFSFRRFRQQFKTAGANAAHGLE
jgi:hypothetical protein